PPSRRGTGADERLHRRRPGTVPPPPGSSARSRYRSQVRNNPTPSARIERAQARRQAPDLELQLGRERTPDRIANLPIHLDELLRRCERRLAVAKADARVPEQLAERRNLTLQIHLNEHRCPPSSASPPPDSSPKSRPPGKVGSLLRIR